MILHIPIGENWGNLTHIEELQNRVQLEYRRKGNGKQGYNIKPIATQGDTFF